jgi:hypothetical protein
MFAILNELIRRHRQLRNVLERAYAQPRWNTRRIDRIANALTETEMRLERIRQHAVPAPRCFASRRPNG